jgi:hypothetical protein
MVTTTIQNDIICLTTIAWALISIAESLEEIAHPERRD